MGDLSVKRSISPVINAFYEWSVCIRIMRDGSAWGLAFLAIMHVSADKLVKG